jgi:hypothetical protein
MRVRILADVLRHHIVETRGVAPLSSSTPYVIHMPGGLPKSSTASPITSPGTYPTTASRAGPPTIRSRTRDNPRSSDLGLSHTAMGIEPLTEPAGVNAMPPAAPRPGRPLLPAGHGDPDTPNLKPADRVRHWNVNRWLDFGRDRGKRTSRRRRRIGRVARR